MTATLFGAIHCRVGILDQSVAVRAVVWENTDADATADAEGVTLNYKFCGHRIHQPLSGNRCVGHILHVSQHDEEFVATQTSYCVLFTPACLQSLGNFLQEEIADRMPQ